MIALISGGCKNGKSTIAEKMCVNMKGVKRYYVATMVPCDEEDRDRIRNHVEERKNYNFETIEADKDFDILLDKNGIFLVDSLTAFILNHIIDLGDDFNIDIVKEKIIHEIDKLINKYDSDIIFVSDIINCDDIDIVNRYSDKFIYLLSEVERYISRYAEVVIEVSFSNAIFYKGKEYEEKLFYTI